RSGSGGCRSRRPTAATSRARRARSGHWPRYPRADPARRPARLGAMAADRWYGLDVPAQGLAPAVREQIAKLGHADIMVGIPSFKNAATIGYVVRAAQAGLVQYFPDLKPVLVNSDAGSPDGTGRVAVETGPPDYIEQILLTRPTNRLARVSLTYPEIDGVGGK